MPKRIVVICLVLSLVLGLAFAASAGWRHGSASVPWRIGFGRGGRFNLVESLGLTEEQTAKLKELQKELYEKTKPLRNEIQDILFELSQLRLAKDPDRTAIEAKMDQAAKLRKQISALQKDYRQKMESILTKQQLEKIKTAWHAGRYGRGPGRMGLRGWRF